MVKRDRRRNQPSDNGTRKLSNSDVHDSRETMAEPGTNRAVEGGCKKLRGRKRKHKDDSGVTKSGTDTPEGSNTMLKDVTNIDTASQVPEKKLEDNSATSKDELKTGSSSDSAVGNHSSFLDTSDIAAPGEANSKITEIPVSKMDTGSGILDQPTDADIGDIVVDVQPETENHIETLKECDYMEDSQSKAEYDQNADNGTKRKGIQITNEIAMLQCTVSYAVDIIQGSVSSLTKATGKDEQNESGSVENKGYNMLHTEEHVAVNGEDVIEGLSTCEGVIGDEVAEPDMSVGTTVGVQEGTGDEVAVAGDEAAVTGDEVAVTGDEVAVPEMYVGATVGVQERPEGTGDEVAVSDVSVGATVGVQEGPEGTNTPDGSSTGLDEMPSILQHQSVENANSTIELHTNDSPMQTEETTLIRETTRGDQAEGRETIREEDTETGEIIDDLTDSQLCAMDWSQFPATQPSAAIEKPVPRVDMGASIDTGTSSRMVPGIEDGTAVVKGLIQEMSNLNKMILKTKRELEVVRRQRQQQAVCRN